VATGDSWSPNADVDQNSIGIVSAGIAGGSRHAWTTQQYLDETDNADRQRYSCDAVIFRGHAGQQGTGDIRDI